MTHTVKYARNRIVRFGGWRVTSYKRESGPIDWYGTHPVVIVKRCGAALAFKEQR